MNGTAKDAQGNTITLQGQTSSEIEREAERLKLRAYRNQYGELTIKLQGVWVTP